MWAYTAIVSPRAGRLEPHGQNRSWTQPQLRLIDQIAGEGRATKTAVTKAITKLLVLKSAPTPDDAADALALALWGAGARKLEHRSGSS
ncbi:MAG: crossover junction endodeoxyribonuclease RuvC, partial [Candidatus Limnocylindrus sp.]